MTFENKIRQTLSQIFADSKELSEIDSIDFLYRISSACKAAADGKMQDIRKRLREVE